MNYLFYKTGLHYTYKSISQKSQTHSQGGHHLLRMTLQCISATKQRSACLAVRINVLAICNLAHFIAS